MARKNVDLFDAYNIFQNLHNTYVLCFDIVGLSFINAVSRRAGDLAILEATNRIDAASSDQMILLRIGGDEFALLTATDHREEAETVANQVKAKNGPLITCDGMNYPLSLHAGLTTVPDSGLRYSEFFSDMHQTIELSKQSRG